MNETSTGLSQTRSSWTMWLPCIAMALCSWLSFVDRQVLAVLAPTILKETGMSAGDFGNLVFFFFVAYTVANPLWGSVIDHIGLRMGMIAAVLLWSLASSSHAFMASFAGFAVSRALLGIGEGATFPGGLRTAVETLPVEQRARGIATAFSGGTIGAILTPLIVIPVALRYGWRAAFLLTGLLGAVWLLIWLFVARQPYLPQRSRAAKKLALPNPLERRFWALVFSYSLPAMSSGPILTIFPLYLNKALGVTQADLKSLLWIPPATWGIGYFVWGWIADRYASQDRRPIWLFMLLTALALLFGLTTFTDSPLLTVLSMGLSTFVAGGFQMVALKVGSFTYERERTAMMSGIASGSWSLVNALISPVIGRLFDAEQWGQAFWLVALCPVVGVLIWLFLSREDSAYQRANVT